MSRSRCNSRAMRTAGVRSRAPSSDGRWDRARRSTSPRWRWPTTDRTWTPVRGTGARALARPPDAHHPVRRVAGRRERPAARRADASPHPRGIRRAEAPRRARSGLQKLLDRGALPSIILWGPAGTGKTTLAHPRRRRRRPAHHAVGGVLGRRRRPQGHGRRQGRAVQDGPVRRRGASVVEGAAGRAAAGRRAGHGHADRGHDREPVLLAEHAAALTLPPAAARAAVGRGCRGAAPACARR